MSSLTHIQTFSVIAGTGSLSGAARRLSISTATASAHLDSLESHLGGKLFIRSTRQLVLTDLGRLYLDQVTPILDDLEVADQLASEFSEKPKGKLRVTVGAPIGRLKIAPLMNRFLAQYPDLDVFLDIDDSFRPVVDEQFHVAIRAGFDDPSNLIQRKIASNRRVLVASPEYLAKAPPLESLDDLKHHTLLILNQYQQNKGTMRFSINGKAYQIELEAKLASSSNEVLTVWLLQHCGVAQKSLWEVADAIAANKLIRLLPEYEPEPVDFYAVSPFRSGESIKVDTFIAFLREAFKEEPLV